jgi:hypothetical protein
MSVTFTKTQRQKKGTDLNTKITQIDETGDDSNEQHLIKMPEKLLIIRIAISVINVWVFLYGLSY